MKQRSFKGEGESAEINISPLIDMVFILLIFFIVTTVFVEESGLVIKTPDPSPITFEVAREPFILTLTKSGAVFYDGIEVGMLGIARCIQNAKALGSLDTITIEVHRSTPVQNAASVLDLCASVEVENVIVKTSEGLN